MQRPFLNGFAALLLVFSLGASNADNSIVVQDDTGARVILPAPAQRIISLSPHLTEYLFHLNVDDQIAGTVDYSNYPAKAKLLPRVGSHQKFNLEAIIGLEPDLGLIWHSGTSTAELAGVFKLGIPVFLSEPRRLEDIATTLQRLGQLTGANDRGYRLSNIFRKDTARLLAKYSGRSPVRVFYQVWQNPLMTLNGEHLINRLISHCGGKNIFEHLVSLAPTVSREAVIGANPEIIIAAGPVSTAHAWLAAWQRWPSIRAVKDQNLFTIDPDLINRPTPRILTGMQSLCELIEQARQRQLKH